VTNKYESTDEGCTYLPLVNSGVTRPMFTKFLHNVSRSYTLNNLKSKLRYSNPVRNAKATNEGESVNFAHFNSKLGCDGNLSYAIAKGGQSGNLR